MRQWSQRASDRTGSVLLCAVWVGGSVSVYGDGSTHTAHTQPLRFCPSDCPTCHGYLVENALHYLYSVVIYMDGWVSLVSGVQAAGTRLVYLGNTYVCDRWMYLSLLFPFDVRDDIFPPSSFPGMLYTLIRT